MGNEADHYSILFPMTVSSIIKRVAWILLLLVALATPSWAKEAIPAIPVRINAENLVYDDDKGEVSASVHVNLAWGNISIVTEELRYLINTSEIFVPGTVQATFGKYRVTGEKMYYNFSTRNGWFQSAELVYEMGDGEKLFFRGKKMEISKEKWQGSDILMTGCPHDPPLYSIRAREVVIYPQDRVLINGLSLYIKDKKVLQLPAYSRLLKGDGTSFTPQIGYQREKGLFIEGNYEYLFSSNFFFQATLYYATLQKIHLSTDFVMEYPYLEARLFIDFWQDESSTIGGYVHYEKDNFSLWALGTENERFNDHIFSRSPQFIISYQSNNEKEGFFVETVLSAGNFSNDTHTTWREDVYFSTGYEKKDFGGKLFYHSINNASLNDATAWGGKVWAEKDFSPQLNVGISYEYVQVNGETYFFFDPQNTNALTLNLLYGNPDETFLRLRSNYDLSSGNFTDFTTGIGVGSNQLSVGMEGIYS
ncbi:MAG: DUF3769 domain-containing protein, partial [Atribacterota bacterium]